MASSLLYGKATSSQYVPLTPREAASGVFGSVSLTCWIFLLVPQLIENYRYGSSEGLSMAFLIVWFVGDVANLAGGLWAQLVPVVIAIAVYFCIADGVLITQCTYYNIRNARREQRRSSHQSSIETPTPTTPLLGRRFSDELSIPGSRRRRSSASVRGNQRGNNAPDDTLAKIVEEGDAGARVWIKNVLSVLGIFVVGAGGWAIAWQSGLWKPTPEQDGGSTQIAPGAQVLGYFSAVCYLGARLPQIYKNYKEKSCEGLSLLFFILSLLGNLSYGVGILAHSTQKDYFLTNLPWLIGSLGTMVEDVAIFVQFRIYARPALD